MDHVSTPPAAPATAQGYPFAQQRSARIVGEVPKHGWRWRMTPFQIRTTLVMRDSGATWLEIARALHLPEMTVHRTLHTELAMRDYGAWWVSTDPRTHSAVSA